MNNLWRFIFCVICLIISLSDKGVQFSERIFATSIIIQFYSIYFVFSKENMPFSLNKICYLFSLIFFGYAPLIQFNHNVSYWDWDPFPETTYFKMNILIIIILVMYQITYSYIYQILSHNKVLVKHLDYSSTYFLSKGKNIYLIAISLFSFLITFYVRDFNFLALIFRGGEYGTYILENQIQLLVVENFIRPLSMICLYYYFIATGSKSVLTGLILFILALFTCFPLGMPRFAAASLYIPLCILAFKSLKRKNIFSIAFLSAFFIGFPFLNIFRYVTDDTSLKSFKINNDMFLEGDFDSYYNFSIVVSEHVITFGRQLVGVFLFWVPRSIWPNKPIGSGAFLAEKYGLSFSNISANYFAEGYINFGFIGIALFIIILAFYSAAMDTKYYFNHYNRALFKVNYLILLGLLFYMLRGDLMSPFAYTIGYLCASMLVFRISTPNNKSNNDL